MIIYVLLNQKNDILMNLLNIKQKKTKLKTEDKRIKRGNYERI